jgi:ATPase subunit of ABC transporter with duplicated ATPase domains
MQLLIESNPGTNSGNLSAVAGSSLFVTSGEITRMSGFRVAYYQQNLQEKLPFDQSPLQYMTSVAPSDSSEQVIRGHLGSFGLSGDIVLRQIGTLSGGQKSRIVLAQLTLNRY